MNYKPALESLTGQLAVGSLCLLGIFLILDGRTGVYQITEEYGKSATWGIVAAIPTLVLTYILGIFAVQAAQLAFSGLRSLHREHEAEELVQISASKLEPVVNRYLELRRLQSLLEGATIGFLLLSLGALSEIRMMAGWEIVAYSSAIMAFAAACLCPVFAVRLARQARSLVEYTKARSNRNND